MSILKNSHRGPHWPDMSQGTFACTSVQSKRTLVLHAVASMGVHAIAIGARVVRRLAFRRPCTLLLLRAHALVVGREGRGVVVCAGGSLQVALPAVDVALKASMLRPD